MSNSEPFDLWKHKPWWCQPWSILLTGILIIAATWLLTKIIWLTMGVTLLILVWWFYFIILVPRLLRNNKFLPSNQNWEP